MFEYVFGYQPTYFIGYANQKPTNLTWAKQLDPARWRGFCLPPKKQTGCWKRDWIYLLVQLVYKIAMENHPFQKRSASTTIYNLSWGYPTREHNKYMYNLKKWDFTLIDHGTSIKPEATTMVFEFSHTYSLLQSTGSQHSQSTSGLSLTSRNFSQQKYANVPPSKPRHTLPRSRK